MSAKTLIVIAAVAVIAIAAAAIVVMGGGFGSGNSNSPLPDNSIDEIDTHPIDPAKQYTVDHLKSSIAVGDYLEFSQSSLRTIEGYVYQFYSYIPELANHIEAVKKIGQGDVVVNGATVKCDKYSLSDEGIWYTVPGSNFKLQTESTTKEGLHYVQAVTETNIDYTKGPSAIKANDYAYIETKLDGVLVNSEKYVVTSVSDDEVTCTQYYNVYDEIQRLEVTSVDGGSIAYSEPNSAKYYKKSTNQTFIQFISMPELNKLYDDIEELIEKDGKASMKRATLGESVIDTAFGERKVTAYSFTVDYVDGFNRVDIYYVGDDDIIYGGTLDSKDVHAVFKLESTNMFA